MGNLLYTSPENFASLMQDSGLLLENCTRVSLQHESIHHLTWEHVHEASLIAGYLPRLNYGHRGVGGTICTVGIDSMYIC